MCTHLMKSRVVIVSISTLLLLAGCMTFFPIAMQESSFASGDTSGCSSPVPQLAETAPRIFINGTDASQDWDNCPFINGTGTWSDPYILHDLSINAGGTGSCIKVINTQQYFRVENCTLLNPDTNPSSGALYISNATNGNIFNITCTGTQGNGLYIYSSSNLTLSKNNCTGFGYGMDIIQCQNLSVTNNICSYNKMDGIHLSQTSNSSISLNTCSFNAYNGINLYNSCKNNTLLQNNFTNNQQIGIYLYYASNNTFNGNNCSGNNEWGIYLWGFHNNTYKNNFMNNCEIYFSMPSIEDAVSENIDSSNLVNGRPVLYYANESAISGIAPNAGEILLLFVNNTELNNYPSVGTFFFVYEGQFNTISGSNCSGERFGMMVYSSLNIRIINNNITTNPSHIGSVALYLMGLDSAQITSNNCTGYEGIDLNGGTNNSITKNTCVTSMRGIFAYSIQNSTIAENSCPGNGTDISVQSSTNCSIYNNWLTNGYVGLGLQSCSFITISGNNCTNNSGEGIFISSSQNITITGNNCSDNALWGILVAETPNCTLTGNFMRYCGIRVDGTASAFNTTQIPTSNKVNGRVVQCYINKTDIPSLIPGAGEYILLNCNNCSYVSSGMNSMMFYLFNTNNSLITMGNCTANAYGIYMIYSNNNTCSMNNCSGNGQYGFYFLNSRNNTITDNVGRNNGVSPFYSPSFLYNTFWRNSFGLVPVASFTADKTSIEANGQVKFSDNSTGGDQPFSSYHWDFGDGQNSDEQNPTHQFTTTGTFTVKLTVYDHDHDQHTYQITIVVTAAGTGTENPGDNLWWLLILIIAGVGLVAVLMFYRKRKVQKASPKPPAQPNP